MPHGLPAFTIRSVCVIPQLRSAPHHAAKAYRIAAPKKEYKHGMPTLMKCPNRDAANQTTSVVGTQVAASLGRTPNFRVLSRSLRNRRTQQYSQSRMPAIGGKVTDKTMRKSTKWESKPAAPRALPRMPHAKVTERRGICNPKAVSQKATTASPVPYKLVALMTSSPATTMIMAPQPTEDRIKAIKSELSYANAIKTPALL
mmetsp:Transcript_149099/g.387739  ORF Transcript_149099/g.387739 Transcript_149099/m.387739 type:complete len:201 (-) Transcript_149099:424-1026(-)